MLQKYTHQIVQVVPYLSDRNIYATAGKKKVIPINTKEFRYLRFRAIGNMEWDGANGNWDAFPYMYFEDERPGYGYRSFINKRAHTEHNSSEGITGSIGDLPDAWLNSFMFPQGITSWADLQSKDYDDIRYSILNTPKQKDGSIEVLMRIDTKLVNSSFSTAKAQKTAEKIIRMIDTGQKLGCSMGVNIQKSTCSSCGNESMFAHQYCDHIKDRKGAISIVSANHVRDLLDKEVLRPEWLKHLMVSKREQQEVLRGYSNLRNVALRNVEINHVLSFFELSVVANPAFIRGYELEKFARKNSIWTPKSQLQIEWEKLTDEDMIRFTSEAQERGLISTACNLR